MLTPRACGLWTPHANALLEGARGRIRIVSRTDRWHGGIDYSVNVVDPNALPDVGVVTLAEEERALRQVWACFVTFKSHEESPTPTAVQAAREQDAIAEMILREYGGPDPRMPAEEWDEIERERKK